MSMQFYLVQRNCDQLFPVDRRCRPSLFGHKTKRHHEAWTSLSSSITLSTQIPTTSSELSELSVGFPAGRQRTVAKSKTKTTATFILSHSAVPGCGREEGNTVKRASSAQTAPPLGAWTSPVHQCASYTNKSCNKSFLKMEALPQLPSD